MLTETIAIQVEGSLPGARLCIYIQEKSRELRIKERPLILLCPGGGYEWTSDREAEPMAVQFLAMGYHVAVLRYSCAPAVFPTALLELAEAMKLIHAHAAEWGVKEDQIYVEGCSAGGHLAASLGVFWHESWLSERAGVANEILRPAGLILCYPVITSGEYAHRGSFEALLKGQKTEEMMEKVSLEKQVTEHMPPVFLWHTFTDDCVPVENSLLLIAAMRKVNVPVEFHMYPAGGHGLSTCTELSMNVDGYGVQEQCQSWLPLVRTWLAEKVRCKTETNMLG
ncbi:alpha/beta hydrolase [Roseburia hominis]